MSEEVRLNRPSPRSYDKSLDRLSSPEKLNDYRKGLLARTKLEVSFIRREVGRRGLRVLDLGCGGGRVLIALAREGILESGLGIEIAGSRVAFARRWAQDLGIDNVEFLEGDVLKPDLWLRGEFDLILGISNLLGYLHPRERGGPAELVRRLYRCLSPGGCLLFEFYQLTNARREMLALNEGSLRTWMTLPLWDPFAYYLSDFKYDPQANLLHHRKTFVGRDGHIDSGRVETLTFHRLNEVVGWLAPIEPVFVPYSTYGGKPYSTDSTQVILLIGAPEWQPAEGAAEPERNDNLKEIVESDGPGAWV